MSAHTEVKHPGVALSSTFEDSYSISQEEKTNLRLEDKAAPAPKVKNTKRKLSKGNSDLGAKQGQKQRRK
jgi:hypothetical protein